MNNLSILWGLTGFIALLVFQFFKPVRNRSGWDFIAQVALFTAITFTISKISVSIIKTIIRNAFGVDRLVDLQDWWYLNGTPIPFSLLFGVLIAGPLSGVLLGILWSNSHEKISTVMLRLTGTKRNLEFPDVSYEFLSNLVSSLILVSTKSKKSMSEYCSNILAIRMKLTGTFLLVQS